MNAENFVEFLKDYSKLYQLSYEELKSLAMQYPYCANLHYLLLEKSQLDQNKELEHNLKTASFYSQDRTALRDLMGKLKTVFEKEESFDLNEDYLELRDLSSLKEEPASLFSERSDAEAPQKKEELFPDLPLPATDQKEEKTTPKQAGEELEAIFDSLMTSFSSPNLSEEDTQEKDEQTPDARPHEQEPTPESPEKSEALSDTTAPETHKAFTLHEEEENTTETPLKSTTMETPEYHPQDPSGKPSPTPKTSFSSWVQQFQPAHIKVQLHELMESKKREDAIEALKRKKKKKKIKDKMVLFAEQSLKDSTDLASETLAELLVAQEKYDKAIQMYERLILIFPEKSTYFAEKIKNLKNQ